MAFSWSTLKSRLQSLGWTPVGPEWGNDALMSPYGMVLGVAINDPAVRLEIRTSLPHHIESIRARQSEGNTVEHAEEVVLDFQTVIDLLSESDE